MQRVKLRSADNDSDSENKPIDMEGALGEKLYKIRKLSNLKENVLLKNV